MTALRLAIIAAVAFAAAAGCETTSHVHGSSLGDATRAVAVLSPTEGNQTRGQIWFHQQGSRVTVTATVEGLEPSSEHAWHIHEYGDITGPAGTATGGHYNPEGHAHGLPGNPARHAGDFGNLVADATGRAHKVITVENITIAGTRNPIVGRGVIVHAKMDDGGQPTGNAGARIAQGVIGIAKTP
ncbi:MAG: superoxide dismutase family protein [Phycisphaerales bacterium]|nr:superoxide dismutase family protein [Phycisphaerae bacterium]NNM25800.1 superoxide dismutase family protein [Phycisphaerales bacterium]